MASFFFLFLLLLLVLLLLLAAIVRPRPVRIPLKGRHVLVSGGSSGIGFALARRAAAEGARVSILARDPDRLRDACDAIRRDTGVDAAALAADVRDPAAVARALEAVGPVDVLVCNQGVFVPQELERQSLEEVRFMVEVNLMGTFHLIKAALPAMKQRGKETGLPASIAVMSSQAGQVGVYGYTAYSATKFGLRGLAEALQHEVIMDNIHVTLIFPPDTDTPGLAQELKRRPEITSVIAASSGGMKADDVAQKALNGIKSAQFVVPCNFEGTMLSIATAGLSPQRSYLMAFSEVLGASLMRFIGLCFQWNWFSAIEKCHANKKRK
ncbi:3-ketodihydrosphingosine [Musa troglodytarum]|uniref:3-dehydrosphinganine reductase n=1 Tax=Musa troglodytarum TaxID=320322 RepID=A0A9E7HG39_9LILI|nr:3-ketodihydrosphingosine [Musa troglodytarum]